MLLDGFGKRAEDDPFLGQLFLERGGDRYAVKHRIDGDARQQLALAQRNTKLLVGPQDLRVDVVQALGPRLLGPRSRVVVNGLVIDGSELDVGPLRLRHRQPVPVGLQSPLEHPSGLILLGRDQADDVLVQPGRNQVSFHVGVKAILVFLGRQGFDAVYRGRHVILSFL